MEETDLYYQQQFLKKIFFAGLALRVLVAVLISVFGLKDFFGGDATTYDFFGWQMAQYWHGILPIIEFPKQQVGYFYFVGYTYYLFGHYPSVLVAFNCVVGALHAVYIYKISILIFDMPVAERAAKLTAFFPSLILWSAQMLKDPLIILMICMSIYAVLKLHEKFSVSYLVLFLLVVIPLHSFRNYVFYILAASTLVSFAVSSKRGFAFGLITQLVVVAVFGSAILFSGILDREVDDLTVDNVLKNINIYRVGLARAATTGFAKEVDVSTPKGALTVLPLGFTYLMLAPFPWQITNVRQAITLPEMLLWWSMLPFLVRGLYQVIKNRIRGATVLLLFAGNLLLIYSIFQGNVGTAYRQRAQIMIFLFILIAYGYQVWIDKRQERVEL
ncbi:MAG: glycosyltransferase family 39 protein [Acidobacteriia bacterium]|nr:glycosyltransferase family 39 protein [Terriglobia bacterium]